MQWLAIITIPFACLAPLSEDEARDPSSFGATLSCQPPKVEGRKPQAVYQHSISSSANLSSDMRFKRQVKKWKQREKTERATT
jgi:hypothetical protein